MNEHVRPEDLAETLEAPEDDPRRRHVAGCARCRAQMAAYAGFMAPPVDRAGAHLADARQRLRGALEREIRGAAPARVRHAPEAHGLGEKLGALLAPGPRARPVWAAAAGVAVIGLVLVTVYVARQDRGEDSLRGAVTGREEGVVEVAPVATDAGRMELRWRGVPGADAYQVSLVATDLSPIATLPETRDTVAVVRLAELAPGVRASGLLYGRVVALRMGRPIATSRPITLRAP